MPWVLAQKFKKYFNLINSDSVSNAVGVEKPDFEFLLKFQKILKFLAQTAAASFSADGFGRKDKVDGWIKLLKKRNKLQINNFLESKLFFRKFALQNKGIELC